MIFDYPYTDMHELNLDWFLEKFKQLVEEWNRVEGEWTSLHDYVQNYFDNLNVQTEIDNKINAMIADGSFATILTPLVDAALPTIVDGKLPAVVASQIGAVVASQIGAVVAGQLPAVAAQAAADEVGTWLAAHIDPDTGYVIDDTLTIQGAAADAKKVGDICVNSGNNVNIHNSGVNRGDLTDCNNAKDNRIYCFSMAGTIKSDISNLPADVPLDGYNWYMITINHYSINDADYKSQVFFKYDMSEAYFRLKSGATWTAWNIYQRNFLRSDYMVNCQVGGYDTGDLTDLDNVKFSSIYGIQMAGTIKTKIANIPADAPLDGNVWYLMTYSYRNTLNQRCFLQVFYNPRFTYIYRRQFESTWYSWARVLDISNVHKNIVVDAGGTGDYTKLTDALSYAYTNGNVDIYVKNGTYDITSEIDIETAGSGPLIGKNTRVFFSSKAFVTCHYTGTASARSTFSVFNAGEGDFEIHNLKIDCSNIRYCVHDERSTNTDQYKHRYINCQMKLDNTSNSAWLSPQCIGGGLGANGIIEVDGGYYEGLPHAGDNNYGEISYHNSSAANAQSEIWIKNVYCKNNTVRFGYYGTSTAITPCYVSGCSFAVSPLVRAETAGSTSVNMVMTEWNNEIRS